VALGGAGVVASAVGGAGRDAELALARPDDVAGLLDAGLVAAVVPVAVLADEQAAAAARTAVPDTANRARRGSGRVGSDGTVVSSRSAVVDAGAVGGKMIRHCDICR